MVTTADQRVAVLVDCDNVVPEILEFALRMAAQFGRVVMRRGYGNQGTLSGEWRRALVDLAFTPSLQFQFAAGKNTSDIALALDAQEALFDGRVDTFCLVTSDSDFAYLCRKLRERGAAICIAGMAKTPDALRNACDQFFEWNRPEIAPPMSAKLDASPPSSELAPIKRRPMFVVEAVALLAAEVSDGKVDLGALGNYLKRTNPSFSTQAYGFSGLLDMLKTYDLLQLQLKTGGGWQVTVKPRASP